jgi:hypothetical protein
MSGQRRAHVTIMPLSMEKESLGRPAIPQALILTGSPRVETRENLEDRGMPKWAALATHLDRIWVCGCVGVGMSVGGKGNGKGGPERAVCLFQGYVSRVMGTVYGHMVIQCFQRVHECVFTIAWHTLCKVRNGLNGYTMYGLNGYTMFH